MLKQSDIAYTPRKILARSPSAKMRIYGQGPQGAFYTGGYGDWACSRRIRTNSQRRGLNMFDRGFCSAQGQWIDHRILMAAEPKEDT